MKEIQIKTNISNHSECDLTITESKLKGGGNETNEIVFGIFESGINIGFGVCQAMCICIIFLAIALITLLVLSLTDVI